MSKYDELLQMAHKATGGAGSTFSYDKSGNAYVNQFGQNNGMIASSIPETELRGWMWKRTNVGHRWHHYYFVLLKEGLLYYFVRTDDMNAQNG